MPKMAPATSGGARLDTEAGSDYWIEVSKVDGRVLRRFTAMVIAVAIPAATFLLFVPLR